jgi:hypothetical protein
MKGDREAGRLIENDGNVKVTQEIFMHRYVGTTFHLYAKAVTRTKRQAREDRQPTPRSTETQL